MARYTTCIVFLIASVLIISSPYLAVAASAATDSGCVKCHTNEKILKTLHMPLKVELTEGVG
ncbi:MAG: hypothetical protein ABFD12_04495 [Syntrophorhabdus sp.]